MRRPLVPKSTWIGMWIDYIKETWRELMVDMKRGTRGNIEQKKNKRKEKTLRRKRKIRVIESRVVAKWNRKAFIFYIVLLLTGLSFSLFHHLT